MSDWVDEILEIEPQMKDVNREDLEGWFDSNYNSVNEVWNDVDNREHEDNSFRLPVLGDNSLNCLGRAHMTGLYDELVEDGDAVVTIYYDKNFSAEGTTDLQQPHVGITIDDEGYGTTGKYSSEENLSVDAISDLYKVGLGFKILELGEEIEDVDYDRVADWGEEIYDNRGPDTSGESSDYLAMQGYAMMEEAEEELVKDSMDDGVSDVYIC